MRQHGALPELTTGARDPGGSLSAGTFGWRPVSQPSACKPDADRDGRFSDRDIPPTPTATFTPTPTPTATFTPTPTATFTPTPTATLLRTYRDRTFTPTPTYRHRDRDSYRNGHRDSDSYRSAAPCSGVKPHRLQVQTGDGPPDRGFIITEYTQKVMRALGPSLANFGITNFVPDRS
jgi:hypothetical protein